jgi:hypothetical protein
VDRDEDQALDFSPENVSGDVSGNVSGAKGVPGPRSVGRVRHLTHSESVWIYQRRVPRFSRSQSRHVVLRKRLGAASIGTARRWSARIDVLVDALFEIGEAHMSVHDLTSIAEGLDEVVLQFMLSRMDAAFRQGVDAIVDNGFRDPANGSRAITATLEHFRSELDGFGRTSLAQTKEGQRMQNALKAKAADFVGAQDKLNLGTELNWRGTAGRSVGDMLDALQQSETGPVVIGAGMAAFFEALEETPAFREFVAAYETRNGSRTRQPEHPDESGGPAPAPTRPAPAFSAEIPAEAPVSLSHPMSKSTLPPPSEPTPHEPSLFLGQVDRRCVFREPSSCKRFSEAFETYVEMRERREGLPVGSTRPPHLRPSSIPADATFPVQKTRDIKTLRTRASIFLAIVGDHPLDRYTGADFEFYAHCLRYFPTNATKKKVTRDMSVREVLVMNEDLDTGLPVEQVMSRQTVENGFIGGIRPVFTSNPLPDRELDPVRLARIDYDKCFKPQAAREPFGDALMRDIVVEGIRRKSLMYSMLPVIGFVTARRISALVGLKGRDIEKIYGAYEANEVPLYAARTSDWVDAKGDVVQPSMKTGVSRQHFVLHSVLHEIGFTQWAKSLNDAHIFSACHQFEDHEGQASKMINAFFDEVGARPNQVFHSLRHDGIAHLRAHLGDENATRHQAGHVQLDEHARYGASVLPEITARRIADLPLPRWLEDLKKSLASVDFDAFRQADENGAWR